MNMLKSITTRFMTAMVTALLLMSSTYAADEALVAPQTLEDAEMNYKTVAAKKKDAHRDYELCLAERQLARVKMVNFGAGKLELSSDDVERLVKKQAQECKKPEITGPVYVKITASEDQNQYVRLASKISGNDLDFILTLEQENGLWTPNRVHSMNRNGTVDYGFCGLNSAYHWSYIQSSAFHDPQNQLEYCYNIFRNNPTRFYGYFKRFKHRRSFVLKV